MSKGGGGRGNQLDDAEFPADFVDFIHALNTSKVEYLLVGGYAVGMYGFVRATTDIDFFYKRTPKNVSRLIAALQAFGAPDNVIDAKHLEAADKVTMFGAPPTRIDLVSSISGVDFETARLDAVHVDVAGNTLPVIGLASLRMNKEASRRKKDRDDLKMLPASPTEIDQSAPKRGGRASGSTSQRSRKRRGK